MLEPWRREDESALRRRKLRSTVLVVAVAAVTGGCAGALVRGDERSDEREIYRLLIEDQEMGPNGPILVLEDSLPVRIRLQIIDGVDGNRDGDLSPSQYVAIEDLLGSEPVPVRVPADLPTTRRYEVGDSTTSADARDVLFVSGIGWSPDRDRAVVHSDFFCTGCGWGGLTFFSRGAEGWRIETRRWIWRS